MRILPAMLLLAACGDDLRGPQIPTTNQPTATPSGEAQPAARWLPEVCGTQSWNSVTPAELSMSVVTSDQGAVIFTAPKAGGAVLAYTIDAHGKMSTTGVPIATTAMFTSVAATRVDGRYVVAGVSGDVTITSLVSSDLAQIDTISKLPGSLLAGSPVVTARQQHVSASGGAEGIMLATFDGSWQTTQTRLLAPEAIGMDAATYGEDALVAWATSAGCTVQEVAVPKTARVVEECRAPRLAVGFGDRAELAYASHDGVHVGDLVMSGNTIAATHLVGPRATSPRMAFDGERYWMTYIDARGAVAVGYLSDDSGTLVSLALEDVTPGADGYDLQIVNGQPTVFSASGRGYAAHTICLVR